MSLYTRLTELVEDLRRREDRLALLLSLVIGALVGLVVVAFILLTGRLAAHMYPAGGAGWRRILVPTLGSLVTGYPPLPVLSRRARQRHSADPRGDLHPRRPHHAAHGDREVPLLLRRRSPAASRSAAKGRRCTSAPASASVIARRLGLSTAQVRWLIPVGASAALAAAFNTPIAAVLFSLEEIMGDMHAPILGSVVLSSTTSWMVLHLVLGDEPLFHVAGYQLVDPAELLVYVVLGIVGGFGSVGIRQAAARASRGVSRGCRGPRCGCSRSSADCAWALLGYFVPAVLGVGYDQVDQALSGELVLHVVVLLAVLKIVATAVCYASGNAGGIFGPSMFIGAMMGAAVGHVAHQLFPATTAGPGAYALVGMGTAFAGIIRTPLTSVIMIFEVTRNYTIIVPLMISNLIAFYISQRFQHEPIYEALARQDGLHLPTGAFRQLARQLRVSAALRRRRPPLPADLQLAEAQRHVDGGTFGSWPVIDDRGLAGMVRVERHRRRGRDGRGDRNGARAAWTRWIRTPATTTAVAHVHTDHPLGLALRRMGATRHTVLPVVSRANVRTLLGVVTLPDILKAYGVDTVADVPARAMVGDE